MTPTRSIPWLRVLIEGVVIVGSILLAFGIDAWWEGRQERIEEQELLTAIRAEAVQNRDQVRTDLQLVEDNIAALERFIAMTSEQLGTTPPAAIWESIGQPLYRSFINELSFTAVTATVNSGSLARIGNDRLRSLLGTVERRNDDADEVRAMVTALSESATVRVRRFPEVAAATQPEHFVTVSPPTLEAIRRDPELVSYASSKIVYWRAYTSLLSGFADQMDSIVAEIDGDSTREHTND